MENLTSNLDNMQLDKARIACAYLFSPQHGKNDVFINSLDIDTVQKAFRKKAKMYHPDFYGHESEQMLAKRMERFIKIRQSYDLLRTCVPKTPKTQDKPPKKIIAVGGAKGGIGKTLFAANLGVILSGMGKKAVVVDLDLGGANMHLYLGQTRVCQSINDFLGKKTNSLEDIMVQTRYGPWLIGGDSSRLGAANINFAAKLKLIRAIRHLKADFIILDLGGDTSYNIMDFFLMADNGVVLTTCDPASYLDAYNFIKVALFRKLNRMFGAEICVRKKQDKNLEALIKEATMSLNGARVSCINALFQKVARQQPSGLELVKKTVSDFAPRLVVNRKTSTCNHMAIVERIIGVSKKMLTINIKYAGSLPQHQDVEKSARDLVPAVSKNPEGVYAKSLRKTLESMG